MRSASDVLIPGCLDAALAVSVLQTVGINGMLQLAAQVIFSPVFHYSQFLLCTYGHRREIALNRWS